MPSTTSASRSARARRWGSSARADRARPRSGAPCCAGSSHRRARSASTAPTSPTCTARSCGLLRRNMQLVFQDPYASLNPRMTVLELVAEPLVVHGLAKNPHAARPQVVDLLDRCGLPEDAVDRYPHAFSGGQRQRVGIARALALHPTFIVADEPVSALDVSVRAQVVNLLQDLQHEFDLTYLFIAHDLSVVRHISHRIAILYCGRLVELASTDDIYERTLHPYTEALAVERADPRSAGPTGPATHRAVGRDPEPGRPADRVPVPDAMPARRAALPGRVASARGEGTRPLGRLLRALMIQDPVPQLSHVVGHVAPRPSSTLRAGPREGRAGRARRRFPVGPVRRRAAGSSSSPCWSSCSSSARSWRTARHSRRCSRSRCRACSATRSRTRSTGRSPRCSRWVPSAGRSSAPTSCTACHSGPSGGRSRRC